MRDWKKIKIADVAISVNAGGTPRRNKKEYWENGNIPWLKISDMKSKYISKTEECITEEGISNSSTKLFPKGTVIFSIFASLGSIGILKKECTSNQAIAGIVPNNELIDTEYLYYCLQSEKKKIISKKSHATQDNINLTILRNHEIPLPSLETQKKIVSILEKAEMLKDMRKEAERLTDDFLKSLFLEMFGDIGKNPKGFIKSRIRDNIIKVSNTNPTISVGKNTFTYIDISSIDNTIGRIVNTNEIIGLDAPSRAKQIVHKKDVIVSTVRPNLNTVSIVPDYLDKQICSTGFCVLRVQEDRMNHAYLYAIARSNYFIESLVKVAKGASYPAVSNNDIYDIQIPLPPISLQNKFAETVQKVEAIKEKQDKSRKDIDDLFSSLMQRAFRGELV